MQDNLALIYTWIFCKRIQMSHSICKQGVKDVDVKDTKCDVVSPESPMFCADLFSFWYLVPLLPGQEIPTGHVMKKRSNHHSFSLF